MPVTQHSVGSGSIPDIGIFLMRKNNKNIIAPKIVAS
jgi:hypothetical protein